MEDNFKNIIIIILILVLFFLVYKKMNNSDTFFNIIPNESFTNGMLSFLNNTSIPQSSNIPQSTNIPHASSSPQSTNIPQSSLPNNLSSTNCKYENYNYSNILEPINSNVVNNNAIITNMGEHELIHMNTSIPYLINDKIPLENSLGCNNAIQLENESEHFNYNKKSEFNVTGIEDLENELYEITGTY